MTIRTRLDGWRDQMGRIGTIYGTGLLAGSCFTGDALTYGAPAAAVAAGLGLVTCVRPWRNEVPAELTGLYLTPAVTLVGGMLALRLVDGAHPIAEGVGTLLWGGLTWWVRPSRVALHLIADDLGDVDPADQEQEYAEPLPVLPHDPTPEDRLVHWWALAMAREGRAAAGTWLEDPVVDGPGDFTAEIVAPVGVPVPRIDVSVISAHTGIPSRLITIEPVPGRGDNRRRLVVAQEGRAANDLHTIWAEHVASGKGMPGAVITAVRYGNTSTGEEIAS